MRKNPKGSNVIGLLIIIVILGITSVNNSSGSNARSGGADHGNGPKYEALAKCTNQPILNHVPSIMANYSQITPLGAVEAPDHVFPTDHLYFGFKDFAQGITPAPVTNIFAPGNIVVTYIQNTFTMHNGKVVSNDNGLYFFGCKGVYFKFDHIQTLSGQLAKAIIDRKKYSRCSVFSPAPGELIHGCDTNIDIKLSSGTIMGTVGGNSALAAFDFGAYKIGYTDPGFIDTKFYPLFNAVCGLDYFTATVKAQLYNLLSRSVEPRCGTVGQDKAGTAQGGWFSTQDIQTAMNHWDTHLALLHNNFDPTMGELTVAGTISQPAIVFFTPTHSGLIDREPSEVTADGKVYCYQSDPSSHDQRMSMVPVDGKYLLELLSNKHLKIEYQSGSCTDNEAFATPTDYYR